jgi:hypothetical protein
MSQNQSKELQTTHSWVLQVEIPIQQVCSGPWEAVHLESFLDSDALQVWGSTNSNYIFKSETHSKKHLALKTLKRKTKHAETFQNIKTTTRKHGIRM